MDLDFGILTEVPKSIKVKNQCLHLLFNNLASSKQFFPKMP